jgi:hypothetical protein
MIDPVLVGLVSAATALVASIAGPITTIYVGRAQIKADVLSANRQKWIDGLRELIASFCAQVAVIVQVRERFLKEGEFDFSLEPELLRHFERIVLTFTKIRLMIDPHEKDHQKLLGILGDVLSLIRTAPLSQNLQGHAEATAREIVEITQKILRHEWALVKRGA